MQHYMTAARLLSGLMISTTLLTPAMAMSSTVNPDLSNLPVIPETNASGLLMKTQDVALASVSNGAWYQDSHSGTVGYFTADYLHGTQDAAAALPSADSSMYVEVVASDLNVRTGPGTGFPMSGKLHTGDVVKVLSVKNGWYQLENGYIGSEHVVNTTAPEKPAPAPVTMPAEMPEYVEAALTLNVRTEPNAESEKAGKVLGGDVVKVLGMTEDGWYQVEKGFISAEYAVKAANPEAAPAPAPVQEAAPAKKAEPAKKAPAKEKKPSFPQYVKITASSLKVRSGAGTNHDAIGKLSRGDVVKVKGVKNGWYQVENGYISDDYAVKASKPAKVDKVQPISKPSDSKKPDSKKPDSKKPASDNKPAPQKPSASNGSKGQQIANYAKQFKGYRYVHGGASPSGFDCSGFTSYVYAQFGYKLNRTAAGQLSNGKAVSKSQIQPGDLVLFRKSGSSKAATHVGLYIGGGQFIHASTPKKGVIISDLNSNYYTGCFVGARRIV